ncbi:MAG TPA: peptide chain release factor N(5)-glutamine methyltransferase [Sphingomonadaceae bacterium]|nr:peptide chain release factor N(5)-glutamine methyltransferase [Sphingomonadaceae bacterium]
MKVAEALRDATKRLEGVSDTARLDAELLLAEALGTSRSELLLRHMDNPVPPDFEALVARRLRHEPVAYILGRQEFFGREFLVTPDVLIPRADSETTVAAALQACPSPGRVLDCGTGSGALLLTLLAECPAAEGIGIDRSLGALAVASANAAKLGLARRTRMLARNWREPGWSEGIGRFDLVIANPPYVEANAELSPSVRHFEPAGALFSGKDGLDDYRILVPQLPSLLAENGLAVLEIGAEQAEKVEEIARLTGFSAELCKDLAARPRALVLRLGLGKSESAR